MDRLEEDLMSSDYEIELIDINRDDDLSGFNCGDHLMNDYLSSESAYYEHIMKLAMTKLIKLDEEKVVGYFTLQFKTIRIEEDDSNIYPCICLKYICIHIGYQNKGIGTKVLNYIVKQTREISNFVGCRCLLIDAITSKIEWYKNRGFDFIEEDDMINYNESTVKMFMDFRDKDLIDSYFQV
jgi:GNAT superfamily N-acetyltransferase